MSEKNLYYRFRRTADSKGTFVFLAIYDKSEEGGEIAGKPLSLRMNGEIVGEPIPTSAATYPEFLPAGAIMPDAYFEVRFDPSKLNPGITAFDCVNNDGNLLSDAANFGIPTGYPYRTPDEVNIKRVASKVGANGFLVSGACWYSVFMAFADREFGGLAKDANILDWGAGCGRIARYFHHDGFRNLRGIDIDQFNVDWSRQNIDPDVFMRCDFDPPAAFPDNHFDAIYAHSVLTHLAPDAETAWLAELNRILAPGGFAVCTIVSEHSAHMIYNLLVRNRPDYLKELARTGRQDFGADSVGVDAGREGYYRFVAHSREFVMREWNKIVDVVKIVPGWADNQDAVIFRKKTL